MGRSGTFLVVIPARYASSRLHGKPLADIAGKPMVVHVADRARASGAKAVWVATDSQDVFDAVERHGHQVMMTRADHASGTDRIAEVAEQLGLADGECVVNVQGDEPLIDPALIRDVATQLATHADAVIATLAHPIESHADFINPNAVKVVANAQGYALYFSRAPIPWPRDAMAAGVPMGAESKPLRHIGLYAYRAGFLRTYASLAPSPLENIEMLEQLRVLWHGYRISLGIAASAPAPGVDTAEDLERVRALLAARV